MLSGPGDEVQTLVATFQRKGVRCELLETSHAFQVFGSNQLHMLKAVAKPWRFCALYFIQVSLRLLN